jgi:PAS domain S-box-containing protein
MIPAAKYIGTFILTRPVPLSDLTLHGTRLPDGTSAREDVDIVGRLPTVNRVVSLMPGFVYVYNHTNHSNDYTNRSVGEHLGYSSEEIRAFGDQMLVQLVHEDDLPLLGEHLARIGKLEADNVATIEYRVITKNGEERWLRSVDTVFDRAPDGTVLRHIGCASDVTCEKRAVLRLSQLNTELEQKVALRTRDLARLNAELESRIDARTHELQAAVEELEQLTYIATHDLKVPVNNLCRLGLMLAERAHLLEEDQAEQVGWINDCADQLSAKIQGLVLVAQIRLSEGLPVEALNLAEAVRRAVDQSEKTMGHSALPVITDVPGDLTVHIARFELGSILASLLDNSVKYADPARSLQVRIIARLTAGQVTITVSDNGTGVDGHRDSDKVFGLFQRAHKEPAGTGISLYCIRRMIQKRGGEVTVTGRRGEGAEFSLKLPGASNGKFPYSEVIL